MSSAQGFKTAKNSAGQLSMDIDESLVTNERSITNGAESKEMGQGTYEICIECAKKEKSHCSERRIKEHIRGYILSKGYLPGGSFAIDLADLPDLQNSLDYVHCRISTVKKPSGKEQEIDDSKIVDVSQISIVNIYIFTLSTEGPAEEAVDEEDDSSAANAWLLPSTEFVGLWDSLIFSDGIKEKLLQYAYVSMLLADRQVKKDIVSVNRVVLLYGPTGTGKTTLCKALAQKLSIRLSGRYTSARLVEINSHSLFSKYFSESGKLVLKMFNAILDMLEDPNCLVMILIDEVESLALARKAVSGNEPTDSIRVVNALLTQLDQIKRFPNVLIFATSNMTSSIDLAFLDRADIKQYIGNPDKKVISSILSSCIEELIDKGIITVDKAHTVWSHSSVSVKENNSHYRDALMQAAQLCEGLSGRVVRKLPVLALVNCSVQESIPVEEFLESLEIVAGEQQSVQNDLKQDCL